MTKITMTRRGFGAALAAGAAATAMPRLAAAQETALPRTMIWTTYDVGSSNHSQASALADAFMKAHGTRIRLLPSGTAIGRLAPLTQGKAGFAFVATELYFATRGLYDFGTEGWGPQPLRAIAGNPAAFGLVTTKESGIRTLADLKGKRFAYTEGNPSIAIKNDALLAAAGLTRDDVQVISFPGYTPSLKALIEGRADVAGALSTSSPLYELEASSRGISWVELDPSDATIWSAIDKVAPMFGPIAETAGAGIDPAKPVNLMGMRSPMIATTADHDEAEVHAFVKAMDEEFDSYKAAMATMERWSLEQAAVPPIDAPFHTGVIRYLTEKGLWTDAHQAWNDAQVATLEKLAAAWSELSDLKGDELAATWADKRDAILG
ncbi:TAXI family TRAP transporter solute-binding subunit [Salipiger sp.]|uniref:TAXI family TRAP transporter solute-binding subunit n=1 Tax=Salipiger sp. TaxID=2078585 RepID=UPI003A9843EB